MTSQFGMRPISRIDQSYGTALARAAIAYFLLVPPIVFLVVYILLPLILAGQLLPTSLGDQVAEFIVFFFAVVWGVIIIFPVVAILRSRTTRRAVWGTATAAVTIEALACILVPGLAVSGFAIDLVIAAAVFRYVASRIVTPVRRHGTHPSAESPKA